jgi:hypothetical protein
MKKKSIPFVIAYDFDGTLAPGNMQERNFIPAIKMTKKAFWNEVGDLSKKHGADNILIYMMLMLRKASQAQVPVHRNNFVSFGKDLEFFEGVLPAVRGDKTEKGWFDRINSYGKHSGVAVQHFVVSSGIGEMVAGTPIAKKFKAVYASSFCYDHNDLAFWPAQVLNFTTKTQYLFRINKGCLDVHDKGINTYIPDEDRPFPFSNMVYIGDGDTDIPCFRLVKDRGGNSIAVFPPRTKGARDKSTGLLKDGRINFVAPADYRDGGPVDKIIKALIDKVSSDAYVNSLKPSKGVLNKKSVSPAKKPSAPVAAKTQIAESAADSMATPSIKAAPSEGV